MSMKHLACIMDGNRRWARAHFYQPHIGHKQGAHSIELVTQFCLEKNIKHLSLYTFSVENFKRSEYEKNYIFDLILKHGRAMLPDMKKQGVRIKFIGFQDLFPVHVKKAINELEQETHTGSNLQVNFLFCYGSRQELLHVVKQIAQQIQEGLLDQQDITYDVFNKYLLTKEIPEPDLILRTGGVQRLSNFLLYQAAYSELYFIDCFWPDISRDHLEKAFTYYQSCKRNFGA